MQHFEVGSSSVAMPLVERANKPQCRTFSWPMSVMAARLELTRLRPTRQKAAKQQHVRAASQQQTKAAKQQHVRVVNQRQKTAAKTIACEGGQSTAMRHVQLANERQCSALRWPVNGNAAR